MVTQQGKQQCNDRQRPLPAGKQEQALEFLPRRLRLDVNAGLQNIVRIRQFQHRSAAAKELHIGVLEKTVDLAESFLKPFRHPRIDLRDNGLQLVPGLAEVGILLLQKLIAFADRFVLFNGAGVHRPQLFHLPLQ